ncbi:MAG TPA: amidohydrolase family protein, partial [Polyangiaceae bacterium]|nr:amidohydrolase family protein [Polyangiaceae bacterium]
MTPGALEIDATLLPSGERRTLWVRDGRIRFEPQASSAALPPGGFVLSGLVDAHTHADYPQDALPDGGRPEFVRGNLRQFAQAGVLLMRDLGASSRTLEQLQRADGEPRVIPAGEALIGCANPCFPVTTPEQMRQHAVEQIRPGVQWVKIFTDWPDPSVEVEGKSQYFGEDNPLTCPPEKLTELVAAVHEKGGRVASHVFTKLGAEASVAAGVDSIEHGWGIDESLFPTMLEKNIAWVPLVAIAAPMLEIATRDGRPDQHAWIETCRARLRRTLPAAVQAGVVLLTGTDWFPMISVADEINTLVQMGVPPSA